MRKLTMTLMAVPLLVAATGRAQWVTQQVDLQPGWNAVFLAIDPEPSSCDLVFSNLPFAVKIVLTYKQDFSSVEFISETNDVITTSAEWLQWFPTTAEISFSRSLFKLLPNRPYFVKVSTAATGMVWSVKGRPRSRGIDWRESAYNLAGFPVSRTIRRRLQRFLRHPLHMQGRRSTA